jgi:outer membrane receptor protein involved in Fe transport
MKKLAAIFLTLLSFTLVAQGQRTVTGKVTDDKGAPIQGASVLVKGTNVGASTNTQGIYLLTIPQDAKVLSFSAVNSLPTEVTIGSQSTIDAILQPKNNVLQEVVVTSLGIARDKRSLGFSTQTVKGSEIADRGEVNIVNALQGKVAGVSITGASGSAGASSNINIRGITSFTGSNQPLFVVDGIPISNEVDRTNGGPNGTLGDNQPANRALDIDMNNIESSQYIERACSGSTYTDHVHLQVLSSSPLKKEAAQKAVRK